MTGSIEEFDHDLSDEAAIALVIAGNRDVFARIVRRYEPQLLRFVTLRLPDPSLAADVVQRTFLVLLDKLDAYDPARPLLAWLRGIAVNQCRREWRAARRQAELKERLLLVLRADAHLRALDREEATADEERLAALRLCVAELPEDERRLVELRFHERRPLERVAALVGRSGEAVRLALFRLRRRLRACIRRRLEPGGR